MDDYGWKILGCAATGVVAMVAAPVLAPVGAITAAGAVIGAVGGGAAGAAWGAASDLGSATREQAAEQRGHNQAKAKYGQKLQEVKARYEEYIAHQRQQASYWDLILALYSVGFATLLHVRRTDRESLAELKQFIGGLASDAFPEAVCVEMNAIEQAEPDLKTVMVRAQKVMADRMELCDEVVALVGDQATLANWQQLRYA